MRSPLQTSTARNAPTIPDELPVCGRCRQCHPGRQWGGDEKCTVAKCSCHRGGRP